MPIRSFSPPGATQAGFLNWAPQHTYRGLNPDKSYWFWFYKDEKKVEDQVANQTLSWPLTVPVPHPYDFRPRRCERSPMRGLCGSATGRSHRVLGCYAGSPGRRVWR